MPTSAIGRQLTLLLCVVASASRAEDVPVSKVGKYSHYEQESIDDAAKKLGESVDPNPEGKIIESIESVRLEVLEDRDVIRTQAKSVRWLRKALNSLHATSKDYIIKREVLQKVGDRYRVVIADETARNLRGLSQLSLVIVTAMRGSHPDRVKVLVITKDVWSLRLNWNAQIGAGGVQLLEFEPSERNIAGTQQTGSFRFSYQPESTLLGAGYRIPRLDGRRLQLSVDANAILNNRSNSIEGGTAAISLVRPLFSTRTEWAYNVGVSARTEVLRRYVDAHLSTFDAKSTPEKDAIPFQYRAQRMTVQAGAVRSFGWANKFDIAFGGEMNLRQYRWVSDSADPNERVPVTSPTGEPVLEFGPNGWAVATRPLYNPAAIREFTDKNVPVSDDRVGPYLELRAYTTNFMRVLNLETLGLQEDWRLGYNGVARIYPVLRALGSSRDLFGTYLGAQYTWPLGNGMMRVTGETTNEFTAVGITDGAVSGSVRVASPTVGIGRFVFDASMLYRYANYLNRTLQLGGNTRLRGFPTNFFVGKNMVSGNLEYRTKPLDVFSIQVALAAFWDMGDAFDGWSTLLPKQSVGGGFRLLIPQFDRIVFRGDLGVPLPTMGSLPTGVSPVSFFFSFGQAFSSDVIGNTAVGVTATTGGYLGQ